MTFFVVVNYNYHYHETIVIIYESNNDSPL